MVAALGLALLLGACGHDDASSSGATHSGPPGGSQTTVRYPEPRCARDSAPGLCAAVRTYLIWREHGDLRQAYAALSTRCRADISFARFKHREGLDAPRGLRIYAHLSDDRARASVIYSLPWTASTNVAQAWVKEGGKWKNDGCQPQ